MPNRPDWSELEQRIVSELRAALAPLHGVGRR
jgi:hypothetical protein